jgi:hypothetical protein
MLYIATLYTRSKSEPCFEAQETRRFGTLAAVQAWADSVLPVLHTTRDCYHRDLARADYINVVKRRPIKGLSYYIRKQYRDEVWCTTIEPKTYIVPSCGELGYF